MQIRREIRRADIHFLRSLIESDLSAAAKAFAEVNHAEDSVKDQAINQAALDMLRAVADVQKHSEQAVQTLAVALAERGVRTTSIARATHLSRGTVARWRDASDAPEADEDFTD